MWHSGKKVAAQAIGDLAGIDAIVLLLSQCNRPQHHRVRDLHLGRVRQQVIIDPAREDRRLHRHHPWLRQSLEPPVQLIPRCADGPFPVDLTARILYAVADCLLVNIQSDVIHNVS
jgi:hypothetical protein